MDLRKVHRENRINDEETDNLKFCYVLVLAVAINKMIKIFNIIFNRIDIRKLSLP